MEVISQFHAPPLYPRRNSFRYYRIGDLVGLRAGLDVVEKRKILCIFEESNSDSSTIHPVGRAIPTLIFMDRN
jgi:hypothetical protein